MNDDTRGISFYKLLKNIIKDHDKKNVILRNSSDLGHPFKEIEYSKFNQSEKELFVEIMVNFMGICGSSSQLPSYMLDKFAKSESEDWKLFFDFFNNYLLWIFFESISTKSYPMSFQSDFSDRISKILFNMLGIKDKKIAKTYLPFAPLILSLRRPKIYIQKVLQYNFNLKDKLFILENIPHQIVIAPKQRNCLGNFNNTLNSNFILGKKALSYQNKIAIYIKDISYNEALKYFPNAQKYNEIKNSIIFLTNNEFAVDLYLKINYSRQMNLKLKDKTHSKLGYASTLHQKDKKSHLMVFKLYS
ncbi:type VI secretion system baseplate subunit TssG [Campylobacter sp. CCUG 57310]|uniref:type VI secretion system baseplate subunit TssG n=1 Tax=Campylobacter sp. CCUG 57310 TaxID=2517362 RepID=UPI001564FE90|nr:type VI secretion system baseplate subunit TssG [Campylobacter sp. CCUG 57310]QKF91454.1 type VI secretion system, baseplate protein [Campylobacter sp. CCUG 57310]